MKDRERLPSYSLFGQPLDPTVPVWFHVELISERRSLHNGQVELHRHPHLHQLTLWLSGSGEYWLGSERVAVTANKVCWVPAGCAHGFTVGADTDALVFSMARDQVADDLKAMTAVMAADLLHRPGVIGPDEEVASIFRTLLSIAERESRQARWACQDALRTIARLVLIEACRQLMPDSGLHGFTRDHGDLSTRLEDFLDREWASHPSVRAIARALGSTPYLLNRASQSATGMTVSARVEARVMREAQRLLMFTVFDIWQVAQFAGFDDPSHFSRAFRRAYGMAPSAWRARFHR